MRGVEALSGAPPSSAATSTGSRQASSALPAPDVCAGIAWPISVNRRTLRVPETLSRRRRRCGPRARQVRRLAGLGLDRLQVRARRGPQPRQPVLQPARQLEQLVAEQVAPAGRALRRVAARDERAQQPVRGARHQAGLRRELRDAELVRAGERLEQVERSIERLHALCHAQRSIPLDRTYVPLCGRSNTMSSAPFHSTCSPSGRSWSTPSTIVRKWLPASWPTMLREHRAAVGEQQLGLADAAGVPQHLARGAGWLVAFSGVRSSPMSRSPSGIHADSPLQRTWMIFEWNGSMRSKAATVLGARSRLQLALEGESARGDRRASGGILSVGVRSLPGAGRRVAAPRSSVRTTRAAQPAADVGRDRVAVAQVLGARACTRRARSTSARSASAPGSIAPLRGDPEPLGGAAATSAAPTSGGRQRASPAAAQRRLRARDPAPRVAERRRP